MGFVSSSANRAVQEGERTAATADMSVDLTWQGVSVKNL
jgi:hypothetical protein